MTIETTANRISYTGSGTTGPFSFPYYFLADGDLTVIKTTIADGTEETLTLTTDYTVSGAGEAAGGSVTLVASLSSLYKLTIIRDPDILQPADYPANDRFPSATHEKALDRATMIMQRLEDLIARAFRLSDGDVSGISLILSNLGAGKLIAVNSAGTGIESIAAADVDLATVSAFMATVLDDATAADARTTLGAAADADVVKLTGNQTVAGVKTYSGQQRWAKGADIASANALTLGTDGNYFDVTGTTAITSIGTVGVGTIIKLHFDGALTLTHNATDLILPGGANITTAAGDEAEFVEYATGDWRCVSYVKATGRAVIGGLTAVTAQATTSGTEIDFTGIPAGVKRITIMFSGVSTNGTSQVLVRVGDGAIVSTGYSNCSATVADAAASAVSTATIGFTTRTASASAVRHGHMTLTNISGNVWVSSHVLGDAGTTQVVMGGGNVSLSGTLDRVRITTGNGTDTFDAGSVNIFYE